MNNDDDPYAYENENDRWWVDNEYVLDSLVNQSNGGKVEGGDDPYDTDDSLGDLDNITDDEEYLSNKAGAKEIMRKFGAFENEIENWEDNIEAGNMGDAQNGGNEFVDEGSDINFNKSIFFEFDLGDDFTKWKSDDDNNQSGSDFLPKSSSDEEDWLKTDRPKRKEKIKFNTNVDIKQFDFCVDMIFENPQDLKDQIRAYAAVNGYSIWFKKNDKLRIQAKCRECPWGLYASYEGKDATFKIKSYQKNHKCSMNTRVKTVNSKWLAKKLGDRIRLTPFMKLVEIQDLVKEKCGQKLCYKTKKLALCAVKQNMREHYAKLWNYVYELGRSNPGSTIVLKGPGDEWSGPPQFRRFYICFDSVKRGFLQGCRKYIGVDGCFLKTWIKGELIVAMGRDANNQMFPIAWAVVEKEDQHTWRWFLNILSIDLGIENGAGWTIMSDQQKGLEVAVNELFPEIKHRNCARHIYANFRKRGYTGVNYQRYFWAAAKSTTEADFKKNMEKIKVLSGGAYKHLMDRDPSRWSRAFFTIDSTCDCVDNNLCESFNLNEGRKYGHKVEKALKDSIVNSRDCSSIWNGNSQFEVGGKRGGTIVNLNSWTCTCRAWQLSGIPCCHAVSAITLMREEPEDYIYECLKGETYLKCYQHMLNPLVGEDSWPYSDKPVLLPPPPRIVKGRPKWTRRKDALEDGKGNKSTEIPEERVEDDPFKPLKKSRKGVQMTCSICKQKGHNKKKCPHRQIDEIPVGHGGEGEAEIHMPAPRREKLPVRVSVGTIGLRSSFTKKGSSFITTDSLEQQLKDKRKRS